MVQKSFFGKFLLLWLGESVSAIGSGLTAFGLGVYVFQITGQATATAMTMLCGFLPMILMSVPAGALADRYDRRIMMMLGDGLSMIGLLIVLVGLSGGESTLWLVLTGLVVSSLFAGVMDPAYRASVTDLLSKKDYTRASGMIQLASASKYLISPVLAGVFLLIADVSLLVMIDIATVVLTVITTGLVRRNLINKTKIRESFSLQDFLAGWRNIKCVKGLWTLILVSAALVFFMSFIQVLATPLLLSITNEQVLGLVVTIGSFGMVLSSILIGLFPVNDNFHRTLSIALAVAGLAMVGFGASTNIVIITSMCFLFFCMFAICECMFRLSSAS